MHYATELKGSLSTGVVVANPARSSPSPADAPFPARRCAQRQHARISTSAESAQVAKKSP